MSITTRVPLTFKSVPAMAYVLMYCTPSVERVLPAGSYRVVAQASGSLGWTYSWLDILVLSDGSQPYVWLPAIPSEGWLHGCCLSEGAVIPEPYLSSDFFGQSKYDVCVSY